MLFIRVLTNFLRVALLASMLLSALIGCEKPASPAKAPMQETSHAHYHVHGSGIKHDHEHDDGNVGGHTHEHNHSNQK
jgi:hypothetical protein